MAEEIDDNEFYRENFSADSDWEVFNAQLGEILQKWDVSADAESRNLKSEEIFTCNWKVEREKLDMLKNGIEVEYHQAVLEDEELSREETKENSCLQRTSCHHDLMSTGSSFGPPIRSSQDLHILARIYGLRRFIVLHPVNCTLNYMKSTSEFNFFLSAVAVVSAEVQSVVPIFVQIYDPKWNFYTGVALAPALRTNFRLIGLEKAPPECRFLMGLLTLFREKVPTSYSQAAMISVCTTYALDTMRIRMPMYVPFDHGLSSEDTVVDGEVSDLEVQQFCALPHGYTPESRTEIYLVYTWPELSEHVAFDSEQRSDFVPSKAPLGKVYLSVEASSYLSCCLRDYQSVAEVTRSLESFVGRNFSGTSSGAEAASNPLDRITEHKLTKRREGSFELPSQAGLTKRLPGPMTESELSELLAYLFPDMHPEMALFPYAKKSFKDKFDPMRFKSAVPDSLICRLSCLLATCHAHLGSVEGMAQAWAAFTRQLRLLWDNSLTVPGISAGFPDTRTCLLHQKLQMLNVCVERRVQREANSKRKSEGMVRKASAEKEELGEDDEDEDEDDDEGEFFDCDDLTAGAGSPTKAVLSLKPEGRLRRLNNERLLEEPDEYLYIPETQDPVPKTEDQLEDDAEVMLKLGPGSGLSTQMMCTSLLSDMEAFKAANPRGAMEDFIRWYSPKDWEEVTDELGQVQHKLSIRMTTEGNTWQKVWEQAQAVPVSRQKRLFDDTNEALKVLHYMETRKMHEIYNLTIIPLLHSAILKLADILSNAKLEDLFSAQIEKLLSDLCRLSRSHSDDPTPIKPLLDDLAELERRFYQFKCFERLSGYPNRSTLQQVKLQFEEILRNDNCCTIVNRRLTAAGDDTLYDILIPKLEEDMAKRLISKDYIIRLDGDTKSTEKGLYLGPQFMRAIVTGEKLRLCGAFTESTAFV